MPEGVGGTLSFAAPPVYTSHTLVLLLMLICANEFCLGNTYGHDNAKPYKRIPPHLAVY